MTWLERRNWATERLAVLIDLSFLGPVRDWFALAGAVAVVRGVWMWSHPAAWIVGGTFMLAAGWWMAEK